MVAALVEIAEAKLVQLFFAAIAFSHLGLDLPLELLCASAGLIRIKSTGSSLAIVGITIVAASFPAKKHNFCQAKVPNQCCFLSQLLLPLWLSICFFQSQLPV